MSSRQNAGFAPDRPYFIELSVVRTYTVIKNHSSYRFLGNIIENGVDVLGTFRINLRKVLLGFNFNSVHIFKSFKLVRSVDGLSHLRSGILSYSCIDFLCRLVELNLLLRLAYFLHNLFDEFNNFLDFLVGEKDCIQHFHFRNFICPRLYHHDGLFGAGYGHIHIGFFSLLQGRIDNQLAVNSADGN